MLLRQIVRLVVYCQCVPLEGPKSPDRGIELLIDEPEIHLHPRWQRLFIRGLTELCAELNAQIILTTHSEEVANAVFQHELVMLDTVFGKELEA